MPRNTSGLKRTAGPGRPKGSLNKVTLQARAMALKLVKNPKALKRMKEQYEAGKLHPSLVQMFFGYAYGKPKEQIELSTDLPEMPTVVNHFNVVSASAVKKDND
jgi:hypothetical protein